MIAELWIIWQALLVCVSNGWKYVLCETYAKNYVLCLKEGNPKSMHWSVDKIVKDICCLRSSFDLSIFLGVVMGVIVLPIFVLNGRLGLFLWFNSWGLSASGNFGLFGFGIEWTPLCWSGDSSLMAVVVLSFWFLWIFHFHQKKRRST